MAYVRRKGSRWHVYYRTAGGALKSTTTTAATKTEAKRLALEIERREERRRLGLEPLPSDLTTSFWELCRWWLERRCGSRSREDETYRLGKHVREAALGALPLGQVTKTALEDRLREMEAAGSEPGSVNKLRSILHTVIERAREEDPPLWFGPNPVERVASRKSRKRIYWTLSAEEVETVLRYAPAHWRGEIATAAYAALRKGEVFGLRREDVDLRQRVIYVRRSFDSPTTKTDEEATIPIPAPLVPYLSEALDRGGALVFPGRDGKMRTQEADPEKALRRAIGRAGLVLGYDHVCRRCKARKTKEHTWRFADPNERRCEACGMALWPVAVPRPMRFHDLRHSTATILLSRGVPMQFVQRILRHAQVQTTVNLYGHMVAEHTRVAVDAAWQPSPPPARPPLAVVPAEKIASGSGNQQPSPPEAPEKERTETPKSSGSSGP